MTGCVVFVVFTILRSPESITGVMSTLLVLFHSSGSLSNPLISALFDVTISRRSGTTNVVRVIDQLSFGQSVPIFQVSVG